MNIQLILGGARSGKSRFAQQLVEDFLEHNNLSAERACYIATAEALDGEMSERILQHQADRPDKWQLIEQTITLAEAVKQALLHADCVLVDCLTLWLTNCLCQTKESCWSTERSNLIALLQQLSKTGRGDKKIILVSNEVGHGIVPLGELSRTFVDQAGWLHQELATIANEVDFIMAGLPLCLKSNVNKGNVSKSNISNSNGSDV